MRLIYNIPALTWLAVAIVFHGVCLVAAAIVEMATNKR